jgi:hypothetical protein
MELIVIYKIKPLTNFFIRVIFIANLSIVYLYKLISFYKSILRKKRIYAFK